MMRNFFQEVIGISWGWREGWNRENQSSRGQGSQNPCQQHNWRWNDCRQSNFLQSKLNIWVKMHIFPAVKFCSTHLYQDIHRIKTVYWLLPKFIVIVSSPFTVDGMGLWQCYNLWSTIEGFNYLRQNSQIDDYIVMFLCILSCFQVNIVLPEIPSNCLLYR